MRFTILTLFVLFFITINCNDEHTHSGPTTDFVLDILKKLTSEGINHLLKLGDKHETDSAPPNLLDLLKLFGNESKEIKEKIEENKDRHSSDTVIEKLPKKSLDILKKIKKIKETGGSKKEQDKKIEEIIEKPGNSIPKELIGGLLKKVIGI
uniref:Uncharacterized protein n=1 Tax=Strongyloides stercoralis TaxID=6248 RepID=A0A0K0E5M6_STRER